MGGFVSPLFWKVSWPPGAAQIPKSTISGRAKSHIPKAQVYGNVHRCVSSTVQEHSRVAVRPAPLHLAAMTKALRADDGVVCSEATDGSVKLNSGDFGLALFQLGLSRGFVITVKAVRNDTFVAGFVPADLPESASWRDAMSAGHCVFSATLEVGVRGSPAIPIRGLRVESVGTTGRGFLKRTPDCL